jgi:WD40 repeat protein
MGLVIRAIAFTFAGTAFLCTGAAAREIPRFVPQLALTDLQPQKVAFAPDDPTTLMSVNLSGRIDLFDISNPGRPVKMTEIGAAANDAAFSPKGTAREKIRIASGGMDGTVRLWTIDGKAAAEPFKAHVGPVLSVSFSPDGTRIVSGGMDGTVRLWTIDGKAAGPFKGHDGEVRSVAFSPDGTRIVSGGDDGTVRLWTLDGKAAAEPFKEPGGKVGSVAFSPDGTRIVSGCWDGTIRVWTLDGRAAAEPFKAHHGWVASLAFSPDGTRIVSGGSEDSTIRLWTLAGEAAAEPFKAHGVVTSVAFSPDGTRIVSGSGPGGTIELWTLDGKAAAEFDGHGGRDDTVAFSPDGKRIVSLGRDGTVQQWTLDGKSAAGPFKAHVGEVSAVAFSPDGTRIVSGSSDGTIRVWTLDGEALGEPFKADDSKVKSVAISRDGTHIVSLGDDGTVRQWTLDGKAAAEPFKAPGRINTVAFSPDGTRIVSGGDDGTVRLWTPAGRAVAEPFKGHIGGVWSLGISPDGMRIVSGGGEGTIRLWTFNGKALTEPFPAEPDKGDEVTSIAFSPDGTRIVSGSLAGTIRLWTLAGKAATEPFKGHAGALKRVAFSPDGTRLAVFGGWDGTIRVWTLDGGAAAEPFKAADGEVESVAFSPDGTRIVSGGNDGTVRLWALDGKPVAEPFKGHDLAVKSVAFSPDGTRIVSGGADGAVRLWTLDGKALAEPFEGHRRISTVAFSPDGKRIISVGDDGAVRQWTLDGKPAAEPFKGQDGAVSTVVFSSDGKRIAFLDYDGTIRVWTLDGEAVGEPFKANDSKVKSVAISRGGTHIVSGGEDGTVRLWSTAARTHSILKFCDARSLGFLQKAQFWIGCSDRIVLHSSTFEPIGEIFLSEEGIVASVFSEGVFVPNDRMESPFRAVGPDGAVDWGRRAVPEIPLLRVRQTLLGDWTWTERIREVVSKTYLRVGEWYEGLGWLKAPFWPALGWIFAIIAGIGIWLFAPHQLATWAMPRVGTAEIPTWKWLAGVLTLFGFLGTTRRPLRAWLRKNYDALSDQNFIGRAPVKEREKYAPLTYSAEIAAFARDLASEGDARIWIAGVGGSGKSALSYHMVRVVEEDKTSRPLPILVDEDWSGTLLDHVTRLLQLGDRVPTAKQVEVLGSRGDVLPVVDSLSERGMPDVLNRISEAVQSGTFRSVIVTSRHSPPTGKVWQKFRQITVLPLSAEQLPEYIAAYAPQDYRTSIEQRIKPLIADKQSLSPLFLRFAIERALAGAVSSMNTLDLILQYVEALRAGKLDLSGDDMLRAASISAREAVREDLIPREIEQSYLRGVLVKEADNLAFMNAKNDNLIDPAAIIEMLVECGLLNRNRTNRRLQFAYDPVAEHLAARAVAQKSKDASIARLKKRILSKPDSAIARAMKEIELAVAS